MFGLAGTYHEEVAKELGLPFTPDAILGSTTATVTPTTKDRRGTRSNGDVFSVESLGSYHLHDVVHHLHDVGAG